MYPRVIVTDKLKSYAAAKRETLPSVEPTFRTHVLDFLNNSGKNHWVARNDKLTGSILYD